MVHHRLALWALLAACHSASAAESAAPLKVWKVHITLSAAEFAAMRPRAARGFFGGPATPVKPLDPGREVHRNTFGQDLPWAKGTVTLGDETFPDVGVRYKGNGTILDATRTVKKSIRIDLDRFDGKGRFLGSKTVNLHCGVADPSKYREVLGYSLYRAAGVPASKTAFAEVRLTVPGKYTSDLLGLYTVTEEVDKPFLRAHFGNDKGLLLKPEGVRELEDRGDDWGRYKTQYRPKRDATPDEAKRVIAFARLVHKADDATFQKEIGSYLDVDGYLRYLTVTAFVANADSFFVLGHNYYLYLHPTTGRFHFVPWDMDRAFANLPVLGTNEQKLDLSIIHPYAGKHRLTDRILAMPGVAEQYRALFQELAATVFWKPRLLKELDAVESAMKDLLARDAKAARDRKEPDVTAQLQMMYGRTPELRTFVEKRTASVEAQLAGKSKGFVPTALYGGPPKTGDILAGPLMDNWDADKDGKLSRDEWLALARGVHSKCEPGEAKRVDQKSLAPGLNAMLPKPPEGAPPPPPAFTLGNMLAGPIVSRADSNKDGQLTAEELVKAAEVVFDEFDKKKAGKLDPGILSDMLNAIFPPPRGGPPAANPMGPKR